MNPAVPSAVAEPGVAVLLLCLGGLCLLTRWLLLACLAFVGFALAMSLAWWRLGVPGLALVELLMGALLTGLALGGTLIRLGSVPGLPHHDPFRSSAGRMLLAAGVASSWLLAVVAAGRAPFTGGEPWPQAAGFALVGLGLWAFVLHVHLLRRLLAFNVLGSGIFLLLVTWTEGQAAAQGLVLVGLGVALLGSLLGSLLIRRLYALDGRLSLSAAGEGE